MKSVKHWTIAGIISLMGGTALADWPQYRGPDGMGISKEKVLASWPADGPKVLWKKSMGAGLGSFAIVGDRAYFLAADDSKDTVQAVDIKTGAPVWKTPVGPTQERSSGNGGPGPGSTPSADGDKVYVYTSRNNLVCLNRADGKLVWQHDIQAEFNGQAASAKAIDRWGNTSSPVIADDVVIIQGGGDNQTFIAFNKSSGEVAWKRHTDVQTHSTPAVATIGDVRQVIFLMQSGLVSLAPKTGDILWKQAYQSATAIGASPVVSGDIVYCSIGYNVGGAAFRISKDGDKFTSTQLWRTPKQNMNQWSTPVVHDGFVYGIDSNGGTNRAKLQCTELTTGQVKWTGPAVGQGEVLMIDNKLVIQSANGKLLLAEVNSAEYKEISSASPLSGQAWGWPAFSQGILLYRTNEEAAALDLSGR